MGWETLTKEEIKPFWLKPQIDRVVKLQLFHASATDMEITDKKTMS